MNLGFVVSDFNTNITRMMEECAKEHAKFLGVTVASTIKVPGCFDMPLAVKKLLEKSDIDAVVTLGAVLAGETKHDEIVAQHAARKVMDLSMEFNKPVALGIMGPGVNRLQAEARIDGYSKRAVEAAVKMVKCNKK